MIRRNARVRLTETERQQMRAAGRFNAQLMDFIRPYVREGITSNEIDRLIDEWRGVANVQLSAIGHSDAQPITERNRHLFADNYALSRARAMALASMTPRCFWSTSS